MCFLPLRSEVPPSFDLESNTMSSRMLRELADHDRAQITEMHAQGLQPHHIAAELGLPGGDHVDTAIDAFDISFKTIVLSLWFHSGGHNDQSEFLIPYVTSIAVCGLMVLLVLIVRHGQLNEMSFVVKHGFSRRWLAQERIIRLPDLWGGQDAGPVSEPERQEAGRSLNKSQPLAHCSRSRSQPRRDLSHS